MVRFITGLKWPTAMIIRLQVHLRIDFWYRSLSSLRFGCRCCNPSERSKQHRQTTGEKKLLLWNEHGWLASMQTHPKMKEESCFKSTTTWWIHLLNFPYICVRMFVCVYVCYYNWMVLNHCEARTCLTVLSVVGFS